MVEQNIVSGGRRPSVRCLVAGASVVFEPNIGTDLFEILGILLYLSYIAMKYVLCATVIFIWCIQHVNRLSFTPTGVPATGAASVPANSTVYAFECRYCRNKSA